MFESGYYPPGAEFDPSAPYNEAVIPIEEFEVNVTETLTRTAKVSTDKYNRYFDDECGHDVIDTDDTYWNEVYSDNYKPLGKVLEEICKEIDITVTEITERIKTCSQNERYSLIVRRDRLNGLRANIIGWETEEQEIEY